MRNCAILKIKSVANWQHCATCCKVCLFSLQANWQQHATERKLHYAAGSDTCELTKCCRLATACSPLRFTNL